MMALLLVSLVVIYRCQRTFLRVARARVCATDAYCRQHTMLRGGGKQYAAVSMPSTSKHLLSDH